MFSIELPSLEAVKGTLDIQSTEDIEESCTKLEDVKDSVGKFRCISENENANEGSNKDSDDDKDDAGVLFGANAPLVLSIAVVGALLQLL
ncbi:hypothetical protein IMZ48_14030 [Candidatus Bathyarchaeota archaeon]|nr:hypothetical protein [Candidatus Bathyarchaeota archaeon]